MEVFFSHKLIVSVSSLSWISRKDGSTGFRSKGNCGRGIKAPLGQQGPLPVGCFWCSHVSTLGKNWKKRKLTKLRLQMLSVVVSHFLSLWFCTLCRYKIPTVGVWCKTICRVERSEWKWAESTWNILSLHDGCCCFCSETGGKRNFSSRSYATFIGRPEHGAVIGWRRKPEMLLSCKIV